MMMKLFKSLVFFCGLFLCVLGFCGEGDLLVKIFMVAGGILALYWVTTTTTSFDELNFISGGKMMDTFCGEDE